MARYRSVTREKVLDSASSAKGRVSGGTTVKLPEEFKDMPYFKPEKDVYTLDVIGYIITDDHHPENIEPGFLWHSRRYFAHRNIGAEDNSYVCLARTFNKRCPICDYAKQGKNNGSLTKDELAALRAKERMLICVIDREDKDEKIQLWDVSYHLFGKMLDKELTDSDDDGVWKFYHPDGGISLRCRFNKEQFNGRDFYKCDRIDFKTRKQDYDPEILDEVPPLDDVLIELTYDQLEEIFVMGDTKSGDTDQPRGRRRGGDDDSGESAPRSRRRNRNEEPDEDPADEPAPRSRRSRNEEPAEDAADDPAPRSRRRGRDEPAEEPEAPRRPSRGGRNTEPAEEATDDAPPPRSRRRAEPDDAADEPPARTPRSRRQDPEDDPADTKDDDAPPPRRPSRSNRDADSDNKCPEGFVFGDDCEKDDLCDSCKIWGACNAAQRKRK